MNGLRIAVLVACYNRYRMTLNNLGTLIAALEMANVQYTVFLIDDASPDKTGDHVRRAFPQVQVHESEGDLFWNRGMAAIYKHAARHGPFDGYLLFNDDVTVDRDAFVAFTTLFRRLNEKRPTAVVGATLAHASDRVTYSGLRLRSRHHPLSVRIVSPAEEPIACDTFNANCVLVPGKTMDEIGGNDVAYWHSFGDIDLGLSIKRRGEAIMLAPQPIGRCDDRGPAARSRHGIIKRVIMGLRGREDPRQHAYLIFKHAPSRVGAAAVVLTLLVRRLWVLVANQPHIMPGSADALPLATHSGRAK